MARQQSRIQITEADLRAAYRTLTKRKLSHVPESSFEEATASRFTRGLIRIEAIRLIRRAEHQERTSQRFDARSAAAGDPQPGLF